MAIGSRIPFHLAWSHSPARDPRGQATVTMVSASTVLSPQVPGHPASIAGQCLENSSKAWSLTLLCSLVMARDITLSVFFTFLCSHPIMLCVSPLPLHLSACLFPYFSMCPSLSFCHLSLAKPKLCNNLTLQLTCHLCLHLVFWMLLKKR